MSELQGPIWLIGCGKMGGALAEGWLAAGLAPSDVVIVEPAIAVRDAWRAKGARALERVDDLPLEDRVRAVVLAVKPQQMADVLTALAAHVPADTVVLSIAAGTPIALFEHHLGKERAIVRAMPNTPAAVGRGATALVANATAGPVARDLADRLAAAVGTTVWLDREEQMHAVTALSGSGPAYVFHLVEAMTDAGVALGLQPELAAELARATVAGAGELVHRSELDAGVLRQNVTSPGGTTAAALAVLMADEGLRPLLLQAMRAAAERSVALGKPEAGA